MIGKLLRVGRAGRIKSPLNKSVPDAKSLLLMHSHWMDAANTATDKAARVRMLTTPVAWTNTLVLPQTPVKYAIFAVRLPAALADIVPPADKPAKYATFAERLPARLADVTPSGDNPVPTAPMTGQTRSVEPFHDVGKLTPAQATTEHSTLPTPSSPEMQRGDLSWDSTAQS